ncbi:MAG: RNA ligase partner protein [Candidatus Omnitrophica bacterium]|nr:RNA ligase partner protein [Candidatus Omnitrophota bacterium]
MWPMKYPKKIVADTSIFINPDSLKAFGQNPQDALISFIEKTRKQGILVYMPPSIMEELLKFLDHKHIPKDILSYIRKKPPKKYEIFTPSLFLYELVEEVRIRINKGLRIAEKYTRLGLSGDKSEEELIKKIRDEFRVALREGIIDSKQDIDFLILAKELEAPILTSDQGLIKWADKLGIEALDLEEIREVLSTSG